MVAALPEAEFNAVLYAFKSEGATSDILIHVGERVTGETFDVMPTTRTGEKRLRHYVNDLRYANRGGTLRVVKELIAERVKTEKLEKRP